MAKVDINQQNSVPRIDERGKLVYSEISDTLFIRTLRQGVKAIGGSETDPIFTSWLATPPNVSTFVNDASYLTTVAVDGVTITGDGTPGNPLVSVGPTVTPAALTKTDDTNVTLTLGGSPSTALLQGVSLTLGWTGTLADSRIASASTWNAKQNALTFGNLTESTSSILTIIGGTGSIIGSGTTIQVKQANAGQSGYLSSTDWSTFNGKQNAITTGTTAQYFRGDLSLATFPTNVSSFTNDSGYITSSALTGYATQTWVTSQGYITNVISSLGYTPEDVANKSTTTTLGTSDTLYPTQNAVKTYVDTATAAITLDLLQIQIFS